MGGSLFGRQLQLMTFGESHGPAMGGVLDGIPAGIPVDFELLRREMIRRKPGEKSFESGRREHDDVEILSGVLEGITLGTPVAFIIRNEDHKPADYHDLKRVYRPGHADYTWDRKFGFRDYRGGGRASARETTARVVAGAFAKMVLLKYDALVYGFTNQIGTAAMEDDYNFQVHKIEASALRCPENNVEKEMQAVIDQAVKEGDSVGGMVTCVVKNFPAGVGEPVFQKLESVVAQAVMSIPAVKGFEIGRGFQVAAMKGSENNDPYINEDGKIRPASNNAGGVIGGISSGEDIVIRAAIKPVSSISQQQTTVDADGFPVKLNVEGRHDACVVPRAVTIIESMVSLALADLILQQEINKRFQE